MSRTLKITIKKPGLQTTIQDLGRYGWQEYGVPAGGAMDKSSLRMANFIVGNPEDNPCLEITLTGPTIEFDAKASIALTGADLNAKINNKSIVLNKCHKIYPGDILTFGPSNFGCRTYLAIQGRWNIAKWLGSYSEVPYTRNLEGLPLPITKNRQIEIEYLSLFEREINIDRSFDSGEWVKIFPGPEYHQFSSQAQQDLIHRQFEISHQSNRMGYRLVEKLEGKLPKTELISSGTIPGTIQVTRSGQIIILMADAQTTGGYHRIAVIRNQDLDLLGQKKPGDKINFNW